LDEGRKEQRAPAPKTVDCRRLRDN
jgi:hypothetical protein